MKRHATRKLRIWHSQLFGRFGWNWIRRNFDLGYAYESNPALSPQASPFPLHLILGLLLPKKKKRRVGIHIPGRQKGKEEEEEGEDERILRY